MNKNKHNFYYGYKTKVIFPKKSSLKKKKYYKSSKINEFLTNKSEILDNTNEKMISFKLEEIFKKYYSPCKCSICLNQNFPFLIKNSSFKIENNFLEEEHRIYFKYFL